MTTKEATCEQLIADRWQGRRRTFDSLVRRANHGWGSTQCDAIGRMADMPLGVEVETVHTVTLSYGGPADYLEARVVGGNVQTITYHYQDWFDGASVNLTGSDFDAAEQFILYVCNIE